MTRIIGISGSLRRGSFNTALLRATAQLVPEGTVLEVETLKGIPLYDGDVEAAEGVPAVVTALKDRIAAADGLVLVSPEYNNSIPGVFKTVLTGSRRQATSRRFSATPDIPMMGFAGALVLPCPRMPGCCPADIGYRPGSADE
jgi:NAD(P)H-dependent FMN reductase